MHLMFGRRHVLAWVVCVALLSATPIPGMAQLWRQALGTAGLRVGALDVFAGNPDSVYALSDQGLILSTDRGESWDTIRGDNPQVRFGAMAALRVDPEDSKRLYVAHAHYLTMNSMSLSTDGGRTWRHVAYGSDPFPVAVIEIDPSDPRRVYMGIGAEWGTQLIRTTDKGASWEYRPDLPSLFPFGLAIDSRHPGRLFACTAWGFHGSSDSGNTWWSRAPPIVFPAFLTRVVIHQRTGNVFATSHAYGQDSGGVYRSTDDGTSWQSMNHGLTRNNRTVFAIHANASRPHQLYLSAASPTDDPEDLVFCSSDTGLSWYPLSAGLPRHGHSEFVVVDTSTQRLFTAVSSPDGQSGIYLMDQETGVPVVAASASQGIQVLPPYPSPFNSTTQFVIEVSSPQAVRMEIYDVLGRKIERILDGHLSPGTHGVVWRAGHLPSGYYSCVVISGRSVRTIPVLLVR